MEFALLSVAAVLLATTLFSTIVYRNTKARLEILESRNESMRHDVVRHVKQVMEGARRPVDLSGCYKVAESGEERPPRTIRIIHANGQLGMPVLAVNLDWENGQFVLRVPENETDSECRKVLFQLNMHLFLEGALVTTTRLIEQRCMTHPCPDTTTPVV